MKKLFSNILVPIDHEEDEGIAVQEAASLADRLQCHIHLLYNAQAVTGTQGTDRLKAAIQERYPMLASSSLSLSVYQPQRYPEKSITDYYRRNPVDLVLLGRKKRPASVFRSPAAFLDVGRIMSKVRCPVLTVFGQPALDTLKNIVLPVGSLLPMRRLLFATYLAKLSHATIHLVSPHDAMGDAGRKIKENLYKSYRLLRENTSLPIACVTAPGNGLAEVALEYSRKIKADLILISPGRESLLSGFLNGFRARVLQGFFARSLPNVSLIPVMTID